MVLGERTALCGGQRTTLDISPQALPHLLSESGFLWIELRPAARYMAPKLPGLCLVCILPAIITGITSPQRAMLFHRSGFLRATPSLNLGTPGFAKLQPPASLPLFLIELHPLGCKARDI